MRKLILIFGGTSAERYVSVATAQNLARNIPHVDLWFWTDLDEILQVSKEELLDHQNPFVTPFASKRGKSLGNIEAVLQSIDSTEVLFILGLHGGRGENGWFQGICESRGIPFTGSGSAASKRCLDKYASLEVVRQAGCLVPEGFLVSSEDVNFARDVQSFFSLKKNIVVKDNFEGSSRGLYILRNQNDFNAMIRSVKGANSLFLVEELIIGRELTVGVTSLRGEIVTLPASEIELLDPKGTFDYEGKYLGKGSREITPARISSKESQEAQKLALRAHQALGCRGCTRTDMMLNNAGIYFLEINTLPGLTTASLVPQQLDAAGFSLNQFIDGLIEDALLAHRTV